MSTRIELGPKIGLIGDAHGNIEFLVAAAQQLAAEGVSSLVQLGDFGVIWGRNSQYRRNLLQLERVLSEVNLNLYVVLGNHEDYDEIKFYPADTAGNRQVSEHVTLLSRAGRTTVGATQVGWLSGAGSIDYLSRTPGMSWWDAEMPSATEIAPLYDGEAVSVLFAHDALTTPGLVAKLSRTAHLWDPRGLAYAERTQVEFTDRALAALASGSVVFGGHYHFPHREVATMDDGRLEVEQVIFNAEWEPLSLGILTVADSGIEVEHLSAIRP